MEALAGAMAAWELWEHALVPSLLAGAGTWLGEIQDTVDICDSIQNFFWRLIMDVPESCPKVALRSEPNVTGMKWRIWEAKHILLKQIQQLEDTALAKRVCKEADDRGWPGLHKEVRDICSKVGLEDMTKVNIPKSKIKEAIYYSHYKSMKEDIERSSKLEDIKHEDFRKIQPYFMYKSIENTRLAFRIRTKIVEKIPGNYKNMYNNNKEGLRCSHRQEQVMTQRHCVTCPGMEELRDGLDLDTMRDMTIYFRRIMSGRSRK